MIPSKIKSIFIQLVVDANGMITAVLSGDFCKEAFPIGSSVYTNAPFLEGTLDALVLNETFVLEGMLFSFKNKEFNVELELLKEEKQITVLIQDRTNIYKYIDELNQKRNDLFFVKRKIAENNKELERLRIEADKANEEKSRFLAMMSHEIRNPLNGILGNAELLSNEELSDNAKIYSEHITHSGKNLKVIVDDILDLSRIEAGKINLVKEEIELENITNNCIANLEVINNNSNLIIENNFDCKQSSILIGDSVRLGQIISNLLSNALKFTTKGYVRLNTSIVKETKKNTEVAFTVEDSGRGMTQNQTKKIFEEYSQNTVNDNRVLGGAGLGLAIVKRLVEAMKGTITVESKLDVGTKFTIQLDFEKRIESNKNSDIENNKKIFVSLKGKRILVADDDVMNQAIIKHLFNKEKAALTVVDNGLTALQKLQEDTFDLVLLDIYMPNLTGDEVVAQKETFKNTNQNIPIFALTANAKEKDILQYIKIGFTDAIGKPFTQKQLFEKISSVIF